MFKYLWVIIPISIVLCLIVMGSLLYVLSKQETRTVRIDCTWAEIQPDIPPKAREECRKKLNGRI